MAEPLKPPFYNVDWDDELGLEDSEEALLAKAEGLVLVDRWLAASAPTTMLTLRIMTDIHGVLFEGLFPEFAGRLRGVANGEINRQVTFGRYRGTEPAKVRFECEALVATLQGYIGQLDAVRGMIAEDQFSWEVVKVAAYAHCQIIKIHPFANGNGRASRKIIDYFAWRYGFKPFAQPVRADRKQRDEYLDRMRTYLERGAFQDFAVYLNMYWERDPDRQA